VAGVALGMQELRVEWIVYCLGTQGIIMRRFEGFSIIELLIVIAIILIIAAIAIPNLLHARMAANQASAAGSLRAIASAQIAYFNAYPNIGYANALSDLGGAAPCTPAPASACVLDTVLSTAVPGSGGKSGYFFQVTGIAIGGPLNTNYVTGAVPVLPGITGNQNLCSTSEQILRMQNGGGPLVTTLAACNAYLIAP
jgi:type IV pilus assembly protein PilA